VSRDGRGWAFATKFLALPHAITAIGHRGPIDFLWTTACRLETVFYEGGIDGLLMVLPGVCRAVQAEVEERHQSGTDLASELATIGYSGQERGFAAYQLHFRNDYQPERRDGAFFSPAPEGYQPPSIAKAPGAATWVRLVEMQRDTLMQEKAERRDDGHTVGGDLQLVTLERSGLMTCRKIHRFGGYDAALAQARERHG
jgi:hypothetical protein